MWKISTDSGITTYSYRELADILFKKIIEVEIAEDKELLINHFTETLKSELLDIPPRIMMTSAFQLGYHYRVLLEKNNVMFEKTNSSNTESTTN